MLFFNYLIFYIPYFLDLIGVLSTWVNNLIHLRSANPSFDLIRKIILGTQ